MRSPLPEGADRAIHRASARVPGMSDRKMTEAQRAYEANLNVVSATRRMIQRTLDILRA